MASDDFAVSRPGGRRRLPVHRVPSVRGKPVARPARFHGERYGKGAIIGENVLQTTVGELGEFALIERINAGRAQAAAVSLGPGDDAAVLAAPSGRYVVGTDMLVQDRHFRLDWSSPREIGSKAIAQNAADVVAMGAVPTGFVVGLGCPASTPVEFVDELAAGMWDEAGRAYGSIAGGDVVRSPQLIVSVTAFGEPVGAAPVTRSGARAGATVAIAGRLGWSAAGFAAMVAGLGATPELRAMVAAHRAPQPQYDMVLDAIAAGAVPDALTDVSDGLISDLGNIARASGVAIAIDSAALGDSELAAAAARLDADARQWILTGGEDHAFAAIWSPAAQLPTGWIPIGEVCAGQGVTVDGSPFSGSGGWESFAGADSVEPGGPR